MRIILLFLIFFASILEAVPVEDKSNLKVLTPSLAQRSIRKLRLDNQLEVLLVSDPNTPYSAAALSVGVGSGCDPVERPGLAHYTEHMLFLGNAKYPEEEGFSYFLDTHGGKRNAFTMADRTVYMFSVANEGFEEGLDRFAHFFISPSFTTSGLQRECRAIHQEYCKNLLNDGWRMAYVKRELCNQEHPFHKFSCGNQETLQDVTHNEIKEWYTNHYSANIMHLCLYSDQSLDELEQIASSLFSEIKNKNFIREGSSQPLLTEQKQKHCYFITPVQDHYYLELNWELPKEFAKDNKLHIDQLVSYILGHEGENSLLTRLKNDSLAYKLACGKELVGVNEAFFVLSIELTDEGVLHYDKVIKHCFDSIQAMQKEGLKRYIYDEVQKLEEMRYCYQTRGDLFNYVMENASQMIDEPLESYPRQSLLPTSFDDQAFRRFTTLLNPEKAHYMLLAPPELTGAVATKREKYMQVAYAEKPLPEKINLQASKFSEAKGEKMKVQASILPPPNPFFPKQLTTSAATFHQEAKFDLLAKENSDKGSLYIAKDHCFLTPHAHWQLRYKAACIAPNVDKHAALLDLFALAFNEITNKKLYPAKLAQLNFSLTAEEDGFSLKVEGFEEKMGLLMHSLCQELTTLTLSPQELAMYQERLRKEYEGMLLESPLAQAGEVMHSILYQNYHSLEQRAENLSKITLEEINTFCKTLFQKGYLEGSCYTSADAEGAKTLWHHLLEKLAFSPYPKEEQTKRKLARFSTIGHPTYLENRFPMAAGGLMVALDFGDFTFEKRAVQEILSKALEEPFFSELRTRQQTAYVVSNWSQELDRHLYNFFVIQSSSHDPRDLLARFELFLESFLSNLQKEHLPKERFEMIKKSLVTHLTRPQFNFPMMGTLLHTLAFQYEGDFDWLQKRVDAIEALSYERFLESIAQTMRQNRQERIAVLIKGTFEQEAPFAYELSHSIHSIKERLEYK